MPSRCRWRSSLRGCPWRFTSASRSCGSSPTAASSTRSPGTSKARFLARASSAGSGFLAEHVDGALELRLRPQPVLLERGDARGELAPAPQRVLQPFAVGFLVRFGGREPRLGLGRLPGEGLELRLDGREALLERLSGRRLALPGRGLRAALVPAAHRRRLLLALRAAGVVRPGPLLVVVEVALERPDLAIGHQHPLV